MFTTILMKLNFQLHKWKASLFEISSINFNVYPMKMLCNDFQPFRIIANSFSSENHSQVHNTSAYCVVLTACMHYIMCYCLT